MEYNNSFNNNNSNLNDYMTGAKISIIGVGGGGGNAINHKERLKKLDISQ